METGLFTGQHTTGYYGTFTDVIEVYRYRFSIRSFVLIYLDRY